jgi:hypothetical protein
MTSTRTQRIITAAAVLSLTAVISGCQQNQSASPTALPDLTITSLSAPASASTGATINVIHTTKNIGTGTANGSVSKFYLCTNNVACGYINSQNVPLLLAEASKTLTNTTFTVPTTQPLGTNYLVVICGTATLESSKANNTNSVLIVITP